MHRDADRQPRTRLPGLMVIVSSTQGVGHSRASKWTIPGCQRQARGSLETMPTSTTSSGLTHGTAWPKTLG